jgi:hypothetical protein
MHRALLARANIQTSFVSARMIFLERIELPMYNDRRSTRRSIFPTAGWLFADLLLALAVIFLSANTIGLKLKVIPKPTPTITIALSPSPIPTTITPTPLPRLELNKNRLVLSINPNGLLNNSQDAINNLKGEVRSQAILQRRTAGLVIAYGGAPDIKQINRAQDIATKVIAILQSLGSGDFVFTRTSYYDPLYILYSTDTVTTIDIYLFAQ